MRSLLPPPSRPSRLAVGAIAAALLAATAPAAGAATGSPCAAGRSVAAPGSFGYDATDVASAFGFDTLRRTAGLGAGQTVAILVIDRYSESDVAAYQACYGTSAQVERVVVAPAITARPEPQLDIEVVLGLAPRVHVIVYEARTIIAALQRAVADNRASVITMSYGRCSRGISAEQEQALQQAAIQRQTVFAGAGDVGSSGCWPDEMAARVRQPSSSPWITAIGGASLYASGKGGKPVAFRRGSVPRFGVWNSGVDSDGAPHGTGGGVSELFARPEYQRSADPRLGVGADGDAPCGFSTGCRLVPDVAALSNGRTGHRIFSGGEWRTVAGNSAGGPMWAALIALANGQPACAGQRVGFLNPALYRLASTGYATYFSDVAAPDPFTGRADNDALGVNPGRWPVRPGYDLATGLGAPRAGNLAAGLCGAPLPVESPPPAILKGRLRAGAHPRLAVTVKAPAGVSSIALGPLRGLRLRAGARGVRGAGATPRVTIAGKALVVRPRGAPTRLTLRMTPPTVGVSRSLARRIRRGRLRLSVTVRDTTGTSGSRRVPVS